MMHHTVVCICRLIAAEECLPLPQLLQERMPLTDAQLEDMRCTLAQALQPDGLSLLDDHNNLPQQMHQVQTAPASTGFLR